MITAAPNVTAPTTSSATRQSAAAVTSPVISRPEKPPKMAPEV